MPLYNLTLQSTHNSKRRLNQPIENKAVTLNRSFIKLRWIVANNALTYCNYSPYLHRFSFLLSMSFYIDLAMSLELRISCAYIVLFFPPLCVVFSTNCLLLDTRSRLDIDKSNCIESNEKEKNRYNGIKLLNLNELFIFYDTHYSEFR